MAKQLSRAECQGCGCAVQVGEAAVAGTGTPPYGAPITAAHTGANLGGTESKHQSTATAAAAAAASRVPEHTA